MCGMVVSGRAEAGEEWRKGRTKKRCSAEEVGFFLVARILPRTTIGEAFFFFFPFSSDSPLEYVYLYSEDISCSSKKVGGEILEPLMRTDNEV